MVRRNLSIEALEQRHLFAGVCQNLTNALDGSGLLA